MRLRFLNPSSLGARYVIYPGAEKYRPYLEVDTPRTEAVVLVALREFDETRAEAVSLKVVGKLVDLSCQVSGKPCRVLLGLAGEKGESPRLTVSEGQQTLFDSNNLAVPANTPG